MRCAELTKRSRDAGRRRRVQRLAGLREGTPPAPRKAWGRRLAAYVVLLVSGVFALQVVVAFFDPESIGELTVAGAGAACVAAVLATWVMMSGVESRSPAALGLALTLRGARDFAQGAMIGSILLSAVVVCMALLGWLAPAAAVRPAAAPSGSISYVTLLLGLAALFEEIAVRGYPFQVIARAHGPVAAIAVTSIVFAGLHAANPGAGWLSLCNTLLAGILLGITYWRTLSLWLVTGVHFAWNWTMGVGAGLPVSGLHLDASLIEVTSRGPAEWTGGGYGPEAGLLLTLGTLGGIFWTVRTTRLSRDPSVLARGPLVGSGWSRNSGRSEPQFGGVDHR